MIRLIRDNELDALLDLHQHLHAHDDPLPDSATVESTWKDIASDPRIRWFVDEQDGLLVASCHLVMVPNLTRGCRPYGVIENAVTRSEYRRRGLATSLLRHALSYAWESGCYKVMLMTGSKQEWVHCFYEKAGFK